MTDNGHPAIVCRYCGGTPVDLADAATLDWHTSTCAITQIGYDPILPIVRAIADQLRELQMQSNALCEVAQSLLNHALGHPVEPRPELLQALGVKPSDRPVIVVPGFNLKM